MWGQKDTVDGRAHLWIQNRNHTWKRLLDGIPATPVSAQVTVPGLEPQAAYEVQWWDTYAGAPAQQEVDFTDSSGNLTLSVANLSADVAAKIEIQKTAACAGDTNGDLVRDVTDVIRIMNHIVGNMSLQGADLSAADVDHDGSVTVLDAVILMDYVVGLMTPPECN